VSSRSQKSQSIWRAITIQVTLLVGVVVFGAPLLWLVLTSFKEEGDMASQAGIVWVPKVQETVSTFDSTPPVYQTNYEGHAVRGNIMGSPSAGLMRVNVVDPPGLQGIQLDRYSSGLHRVAVKAPVVTALYKGTTVTGMVTKEAEDGRQTIKIMDPESLRGREFLVPRAATSPVRRPGLQTKNYTDALGYLPPESEGGLAYVRNSLILVLLSVAGTLLSSSMVAYGFSRLRFPGRDFLFALLLSTMMLPAAVTLLPKFLIFRDLGWIDTLLPLWAPAFFASAFNVFLLRQFFKTIPLELEDAAKIDGCSYLRTYWSVMLPQIKPALAVIAVWTTISAWNDFMGPLIYINSPEKMPVSYAVQIFATDHGSSPGPTMAMATLAILPILVLFFAAQRYFIDGVTLSGFGGR
jgi:multiple sugar transport system permease protein